MNKSAFGIAWHLNMTILSLDLGTTTGWALLNNQEIRYGSISFKETPFDSWDSRYSKFNRWLENLHRDVKIDQIIYEAVMSHKGAIASHYYGGFMAILQTFGDKYGIPYEGVPVGTIKKHATGKGNASKLDMINAMEKKKYQIKNDNEADALALLHYFLTGVDEHA
jgi:Holliday junction resolvasome RuvABC endonuclease subunit